MRRNIYRFLYRCGIIALVRFFHKNALTILLYHGVAPLKQNNNEIFNYRGKFIEPAAFESQMWYFKHRYTILPLEIALKQMREGTLPPYALVVTFDDGYENNYVYAFPILNKLQVPATLFVTTDFVFKRKPLWVDRLEYAFGAAPGNRAKRAHDDAKLREELKKLPGEEKEWLLSIAETPLRKLTDFEGDAEVYAPLSIDQLKEMAATGISIGAHTATHPILSRLLKEAAYQEIAGSKHALEESGFQVSSVFAYPNGQPGDWNEDTEQAVARADFTAALTTVQGWNKADTSPMRLYRIAMDGTDADAALFASIAAGMRLYLSRIKHLFI